MLLGDKQELFSELEAKWVLWVCSHPGWKLRKGEGRVLQLGPDGKGRKVKHLLTGLTLRVKDATHIDNSNHYVGLASDWNLFVDGEWISNGSHSAWTIVGEQWERMNPLCRWGGRFGDANHISLEHNGVS